MRIEHDGARFIVFPTNTFVFLNNIHKHIHRYSTNTYISSDGFMVIYVSNPMVKPFDRRLDKTNEDMLNF